MKEHVLIIVTLYSHVEDEFHFVLECKLFTDIRNRYTNVFQYFIEIILVCIN